MRDVAEVRDVRDVDAPRKPKLRLDERARKWAGLVGKARADEALALARSRPRATLIELLTEAYLIRRGARYEAQLEMGIARPDFVVLDAPSTGQALLMFVQGERWHEGRQYHDEGKALALAGVAVQGVPIGGAVQVWEKDILNTELVLEDALRGVEWRAR